MPHDHEPAGPGLESFSRLTQWTRRVIYLDLLLGLYFIISGLIDQVSGERTLDPGGSYRGQATNPALQSLMTLWSVVGIVIIGTWIYRANGNAHRLGAKGLDYSPLTAVGWYFIPIANLWMPYGAMREIWQASANPFGWRQQPVPPLLPWWWLLWTGSGLLSTITVLVAANNDTAPPTALREIFLAMNLVATLIFLRIVEGVHFMQVAAFQHLPGVTPAADDAKHV